MLAHSESNRKYYVSTNVTENLRRQPMLVLHLKRTAYSVEKQRTEYCSLPSSRCNHKKHYEQFNPFSTTLNMQAAMKYQISADNYIWSRSPLIYWVLHCSCERKTTPKVISCLPHFPDALCHINTISLGLNFFIFHIIIPFLSHFHVEPSHSISK